MRRILILFLAALQLSAALNFTASTDRVDYGTSATLTLNPMTVAVWLYSSGDTIADCIACKGRFANNNRRPQFVHENADTISVTIDRATTDTQYLTNESITLNQWQFVAMTFDSAASAGEVINIYNGSLTSEPVELTYATSTDGSGAVNNSTEAFVVGNNSPANTGYEGKIAWVGVWNVKLTPEQIRAQWMRPRVTAGAVIFSHLYSTGTVPNWAGTGLAGTVTGATVSTDHVPLGPWFGFDVRKFLGIDYENHNIRTLLAD